MLRLFSVRFARRIAIAKSAKLHEPKAFQFFGLFRRGARRRAVGSNCASTRKSRLIYTDAEKLRSSSNIYLDKTLAILFGQVAVKVKLRVDAQHGYETTRAEVTVLDSSVCSLLVEAR